MSREVQQEEFNNGAITGVTYASEEKMSKIGLLISFRFGNIPIKALKSFSLSREDGC